MAEDLWGDCTERGLGGGFENRVEAVPVERGEVGVDGYPGGRQGVAGWDRLRFNDGGDLDARRFASVDGARDFCPDRPQAGDREP